MRKYKFVDIETIVKHKIVTRLNLEHAYIYELEFDEDGEIY